MFKIKSFININKNDLKEIKKMYKNYEYNEKYNYYVVDCFYNIENFLRDIVDEKIMNIQELMSLNIDNLNNLDEWIDIFSFSELNCGVEYLLVNDKIYKVVI